MNIFDNPAATDILEEPVAVSARKADTASLTQIGTVRACVTLCADDSASAGSPNNPKTADSFAVRFRRKEWDSAFPFPPRFGMVFATASFGSLRADFVTTDQSAYWVRSSKNMKAREK